MKRVRCPKCDTFITFDETRYTTGQRLLFECPACRKQFGIRIGISKLRKNQEAPTPYGHLQVIENTFHQRQTIPLRLGDNIIGHYMKGNNINCPIETHDPSMDMTHCILNVSLDNNKTPKYILRDGPSNTGTFVENQLLAINERRVITNGTLITIGATSIILHT